MFSNFSMSVFEGLAVALIFAVGVVIAVIVVVFVIDRTQTHDAIRRNYPVVGRFRYVFSALGEFFRQYFFAMDREELPFNRAQRDWVKHATTAKSAPTLCRTFDLQFVRHVLRGHFKAGGAGLVKGMC